MDSFEVWTPRSHDFIQEGDRVMVRGGFGMDPPRWATVVDTGDEKNGREVFGIQYLGTDGQNWCYRSQIDSVWAKEVAA